MEESKEFQYWRKVLKSEWEAMERGESQPIPRYAIARMMGVDSENAKKVIETDK